MKKLILSVCAAIVLVGCQPKEEKPTNTNPENYPAISEQRRDAARKLTAQSVVFLSESKFKEAVSSLDAAIKFDPTNPDAYLILGQILLKANERERAAEFLDGAAKNFPNNGTIFYMYAIANQMTGKKLPAVLAARRSFEIFKDSNDNENAQKSAILLQQLINMADQEAAAEAKKREKAVK